jgi:hypothetical protein
MRKFATNSMRYNPFMTDADRSEFGLPQSDHTPTVHPVPTSVPDTRVDATSYHYQHRVSAVNVTGRKSSKPQSVHGVRYVWQVGGERPANGAALLHSQFSRKTSIIVFHDETDKGKPAFYASRYENAKGQSGPWSPVVEMYIS